MKITKIQKRNWFARIWSINDYRVTLDDGRVFNCWAGTNHGRPSAQSLLWDLERTVRKGDDLQALIGKNI